MITPSAQRSESLERFSELMLVIRLGIERGFYGLFVPGRLMEVLRTQLIVFMRTSSSEALQQLSGNKKKSSTRNIKKPRARAKM